MLRQERDRGSLTHSLVSMSESSKLLEHAADEHEDAPRCLTSCGTETGAGSEASSASSSGDGLQGKEDEQGDPCSSSQARDQSEEGAEMRRKAGRPGEAVQVVQDPKEQSMKALAAMSRRSSKEALEEVTGECRICQEEDVVSNLDNPCSCSGSLKVCGAMRRDPGPLLVSRVSCNMPPQKASKQYTRTGRAMDD